MKIKALIDCIPLSTGGGVQVAVALLSQLQDEHDIEWQALFPSKAVGFLPSTIRDDKRVTVLRRKSLLDQPFLAPKLRAFEQAFQPDVVFTVFGPAWYRPRAPHLVGFAKPHLIYPQDLPRLRRGPAKQCIDVIQMRSLRRANHIVVETDTAQRRLAAKLAIGKGRISVIGNSVNPLLSKPAGSTRASDSPWNIFVPSAYYVHKNLEIIPAVAAEMARRRPNLEFRFALTLDPKSKPWVKIEAHAAQLGIGQRISTLGSLRLEQLALAYDECSAVYLPTLREISTAVYPEAFFFARPLVTCDMDFARDLCGPAALFVAPLDAAANASSLLELLERPALRDRLVSEGRRRLTTYPSVCEKYKLQRSLLFSLAAKGRSAPSSHLRLAPGQKDDRH